MTGEKQKGRGGKATATESPPPRTKTRDPLSMTIIHSPSAWWQWYESASARFETNRKRGRGPGVRMVARTLRSDLSCGPSAAESLEVNERELSQ